MKLTTLIACLIILSPFSSLAIATNAPAPKPNYTIVILGDSLTDGYGLSKDEAFPALVEKRFHADGQKDVKVLNAGISGSTSSSAPQRLKWFLKTKPQVLAIALGANDGLRGLPTAKLYQNLSQTIEAAQAAKIKVVLFGMKMPANYGAKYQKDLARQRRHFKRAQPRRRNTPER